MEVRGAAVEADAQTTTPDELELVRALSAGDERAFVALVRAHGRQMHRVASFYVRDPSVAEEVVQETWLSVIRGIDRFEGRSSLKTWLFRILANTAKTRAVREGRSVPFSALAAAEAGEDEPAVDPERFLPAGERWSGHWASAPIRFDALPEHRLLAEETMDIVRHAIDALPEAQRAVITMRDVTGFDAEETCEALGFSEGNQRVLLHRARARVRAALEQHLGPEAEG